MPRLLAIATVGAQDVQGTLWDEFVQQRSGMDHKVKAREVARELERLDDASLRELLDQEGAVRNEPCFAEMDRRATGGWTLALLATDQEDPKHRPSDTIELARVLRRWFSLRRPHVTVLEPSRITQPPNLASDELRDEVFALVGAAVEAARPREVAVRPGSAHRRGRQSVDAAESAAGGRPRRRR